jgi:hypothetical protein
MCRIKLTFSSDASSQSQYQRERRPRRQQGHYRPGPKLGPGTGRRRYYCRRRSSLSASHQHDTSTVPNKQQRLTAVEATRVVNVVRTVTNSTADARRVAPHHLREVAPRVVVVRVVVRVLCLLLMPAVRRSARKLDPVFVLVRSGAD